MRLSDRDLLRRFIQDADEEAFTAIVRRYHGLVMSVCRRVTCRRADADDSFQATFLALARRPRSIRHTGSLSSWLYTVAWRTSLRLVRQRRRQPMEALPQEPANTTPGPLDQIASAQNLLVLDEELNELPTKYRDVLVMTYFADLSNQQIADQLDVSRGTVDGRLRRGRNLLRVRLARRGVSLGVLAIAIGLPGQAAATVSAELLVATTELGIQTVNNNVPGTTDLTRLETLVRPETAVMSSKLMIAGVVCASFVAGALGLHGLAVGGAEEGVAGQALVPQDLAVPDVESGSDSARAILVSQTAAVISPAASADAETVESDGDGYFVGGSAPVLFNSWPDDARPVERWMQQMLDLPVPKLQFHDVPLSEVLNYVAEYFTETHGTSADGTFTMNMWPDLAVLETENIDSLNDVVVRNVDVEGMTLRNALKAIFGQTIDPPLTYVIRDELMIITTVDEANSENGLFTRVYPVGHLLDVETPEWRRVAADPPSGHTGQGFFAVPDEDSETLDPPAATPEPIKGSSTERSEAGPAAQLVALVHEMTSPQLEWSDSDGQGGSISVFGQNLVVRQTYAGHQEIVHLLNMLSESVESP